MKRIISAILLVSLVLTFALFVMTGCKKNKTAADFVMPEGGFDTTTPITIKFYHSMGAQLQEILNTAIADFNKIYPNITVEHKSYGNYDGVRDQIKTEISVGNQPNIAYCYPDHIALYNVAGAVQTLDVLIDSEYGFTAEQIADFIPGYYEEGRAFGDGKMYSLPISKSTEVLYYNKTFFEVQKKIYASDVELNPDTGDVVYYPVLDDKGEQVIGDDGKPVYETKPNPHKGNENYNISVPTTWAEMEETCKKIKAIRPTCIPLGYDSESNWFITMCEQYESPYTSATGENFLFNNETNRNFVKMFRTWYENKWVTTEALSGGYTSALFTGESSSSSSNTESGVPAGTRCYMCIGSTGGATYQQPKQTNGKFEFEVGITSIPQVNPEKPKVITQGPSVCIFKKDNPQEVLASWLFVKFLTTDHTFQGSVSMNNGYAPVIQSISENPAYANFLASASTQNIQAYAVKVALEQSDAYYVSPAFNGSSVARDQVGLLLQKCFTEPATNVDEMIAKAFKDAVDKCIFESGQ